MYFVFSYILLNHKITEELMSVAILSDTNSGINKSLADSLGIFLIHMPVIINDQVYYEGDNS